MTCPLCNDTGEQRYWEGRWRDEKAENERLRTMLEAAHDTVDAIIALHEQPRTSLQVLKEELGLAVNQQGTSADK